jgi:ADP-sugar diphosphatase
MLDWSSDWRKVALEELHEEAGLRVEDHELIDLQKEYGGQERGVVVSCGLLDERIHLAAIERTVTREELKAKHGWEQLYTEEDEGIKTFVLPYEEAAKQFTDSKCLNALFLYERWLQKKDN